MPLRRLTSLTVSQMASAPAAVLRRARTKLMVSVSPVWRASGGRRCEYGACGQCSERGRVVECQSAAPIVVNAEGVLQRRPWLPTNVGYHGTAAKKMTSILKGLCRTAEPFQGSRL